ncbi:hypothetical protein EDD18DRAFT_1373163 [Armillaria luteobubalina]|uniref:Uncharacterized protein n=1 Tax=Armillaria luteobubalina TaxID=153913 RepID=A0AA39UW79_9AGAR|nr:hypothetical protein EDD18DRAFT_1373163 [Armillaria luteobubalina]
MRVKQIWEVIPLPAKIKLLWDRLTFSRLTTAYFIFSLCHCIIQVALQVRVFTINAEAATFLWDLASQANTTTVNGSHAVADLQPGYLRLCNDVPSDASVCQTIWNATAIPANASSQNSLSAKESTSIEQLPFTSMSTESSSSLATSSTSSTESVVRTVSSKTPESTTTVFVVATQAVTTSVVNSASDDDDDDEDEDTSDLHKRLQFSISNSRRSVNASALAVETSNLSRSCLSSLNWPVLILDNTKREDIVFIAFQIWVLGMSIVALLNESIPHIFASLATHALATAWSIFQIIHTANFRANFNRVITNGTCGVALLPKYWDERAKAEYPTLALNVVALLVSAVLTWHLIKLFGWQTFKRVGASMTMNRVYKLVLLLSITLQLSFFFMGATISLWIDSLFNGVAAQVAWYVAFYKATSFVTEIFLIPWIMTGWVAVRKESRITMFIFLVLSILYLGGWSLMFLSTTFRWTFVTWRFFSVMATASVLLTVTAFILGIICRFNFGKGLPRYLDAQEPLPGDDFTAVYSSDIEKVQFPSNEKPIPTFSASFGSGNEVPPPKLMFPSVRGPRFFNRSAQPFETPSNQSVVAVPTPAVTRTASFDSGIDLGRSGSQSSGKSFGSTVDSYYTHSLQGDYRFGREDSSRPVRGRRWEIE